MDPISKRRIYLPEVVPAGPKAGQEAERVRTRLLNQVVERRSTRSAGDVRTRSSGVLSTRCSASSSARNRGIGTDHLSQVFLEAVEDEVEAELVLVAVVVAGLEDVLDDQFGEARVVLCGELQQEGLCEV